MTEETKPTQPGLSLNDIAAALQIIDASVSRGAIRGEELSTVGTVRDNFAAFVGFAKEQQEKEAAALKAAETSTEE